MPTHSGLLERSDHGLHDVYKISINDPRRGIERGWNLTTRMVRVEHDQSVDTCSPASSREETVFQPEKTDS